MAPRSKHPPLARNLVLIGGRGCGKSSIAKRLARANRHFQLFSLDAMIRYEAGGASIPELVEREGWAGFRAREREVVRKVSALEGGALVDCGGGVVVELDEQGRERFCEANVNALRRHGWVVYLERPIEHLEGRVEGDPDRPALGGDSLREVMERRDPWYRKAAHYVLDCRDRSKPELAGAILDAFYAELGID